MVSLNILLQKKLKELTIKLLIGSLCRIAQGGQCHCRMLFRGRLGQWKRTLTVTTWTHTLILEWNSYLHLNSCLDQPFWRFRASHSSDWVSKSAETVSLNPPLRRCPLESSRWTNGTCDSFFSRLEPIFIKLFCLYLRKIRYKLECLSLVNLSSLVLCFRVRPATYPRVEHLKVLKIADS
jgi:hypothetical protein